MPKYCIVDQKTQKKKCSKMKTNYYPCVGTAQAVAFNKLSNLNL